MKRFMLDYVKHLVFKILNLWLFYGANLQLGVRARPLSVVRVPMFLSFVLFFLLYMDYVPFSNQSQIFEKNRMAP